MQHNLGLNVKKNTLIILLIVIFNLFWTKSCSPQEIDENNLEIKFGIKVETKKVNGDKKLIHFSTLSSTDGNIKIINTLGVDSNFKTKYSDHAKNGMSLEDVHSYRKKAGS